MTFLSHANQEADSITRTNIATSLPKDLYRLVKDVPTPSEWFFGDDINALINNIKAQQKAFRVDKTYFKSERKLDIEINTRGTKVIMQNRHTIKHGTS